jgi:transcriptional regulator with XRE-family HTH domain
MDDLRFGSTIRVVRIKRAWRQSDLAARSHVSASTISRIERGHPGTFSLDTIRAVAAALDIRVDLTPRWRAGDLDRLLNAKHSALHELVARWFSKELPDWVLAPEVSFAIYRERGVIDIVAWHAERRAILVIELKTDIVDVNELIGTAIGSGAWFATWSAIVAGTRAPSRCG